MFGLHANADITYQINTAKGVLDQVDWTFLNLYQLPRPQILAVQPKEGGGGEKGESRETVVGRTAADMLAKLPNDYSPHEVREAIENLGGMLPMNIFLKQEIDRMQRILTLLRSTLTDLGMAIEGTIIMSEDLKEVLDNMFDAKVPAKWTKISWSSSTIGFWFTELLERDSQFKTWCFKGRPRAFWIPGFFNPQVRSHPLYEMVTEHIQGFLTAMKQEVTRSHKGWALDNVTTQNLITKFNKDDVDKPPPEGVYIYVTTF